MGFGDRIRRYFSKRANSDLGYLEQFVRERKGLEGFIEPRTTTQPTTLLLVDRDGDHRRGAVRDPEEAAAFCERFGIPVYDAQVIGYPKRMREFDQKGSASTGALDEQFAELEQRLKEEPGGDTPNN